MAPGVFAHYLRNQAAAFRQRREAAAAEARRVAAVEARELAQDKQIFERTLQQMPALTPDNAMAVQIPSGLSRLKRLPKSRIAAYTKHLRTVVAEAAAFASVSDIHADYNLRARVTCRVNAQLFEANPAIGAISEKLCATCKGGCCFRGGNIAYLSALTMRTLMDANPELSEEDIVQSYLEKLSEKTLEGACINQTQTGCALPTEMRSDICNAFFCSSLSDFQEKAASNPAITAVVAVQRAQTLWHGHHPDADNSVVNVEVIDAD